MKVEVDIILSGIPIKAILDIPSKDLSLHVDIDPNAGSIDEISEEAQNEIRHELSEELSTYAEFEVTRIIEP